MLSCEVWEERKVTSICKEIGMYASKDTAIKGHYQGHIELLRVARASILGTYMVYSIVTNKGKIVDLYRLYWDLCLYKDWGEQNVHVDFKKEALNN